MFGAPGVAYAGRAQRGETATPNDPGFIAQWGLTTIGAPQAWSISEGQGVLVAVIDSGVDTQQEDLQGRVVGSVSCLDTGGDPRNCTQGGTDDVGHGTHVAGIIAANANNGRGIAGVAPRADILSVKVLRPDNSGDASGTASDVSAGIEYAIAAGARVLNLSLGSITQSVLGPAFARAIDDAWNHGAVPVVAAGNEFILGSGFSNEPAIVVGALARDETKASYSNGVGGAQWALSAPGGESDSNSSCSSEPNGILSTYWQPDNAVNAYACLAGTSMAAPHVAGSLAILLSAGLSPQDAVGRLLATAHDLGPPGRDSIYGSGLVDIGSAVAGLPPQSSSSSEEPPPPTTVPPTEPPTQPQPPSTSASDVVVAPPETSVVAPTLTLPPRSTQPAQVAAAETGGDGDGLPAGVVTIAVALTLAVGTISGWLLMRNAAWAKRTPR